MARLFDIQQFKLINKYALRDFSRSYKKLWVVTSTLFVSLLLLSLTFSIKEALNSEIENNSKELLGGDIQVDSDIDPLPNEVIEQFNELGRVSATTARTSRSSAVSCGTKRSPCSAAAM